VTFECFLNTDDNTIIVFFQLLLLQWLSSRKGYHLVTKSMWAVQPKISTHNLKSSYSGVSCKCINKRILIGELLIIKIVSSSQFDDSEAWVNASESQNGFDIVVHRLVDHSDLPPETVFGCVLTIPGTNYEVREESIYRHRNGRKYNFQILGRNSDTVWRMLNVIHSFLYILIASRPFLNIRGQNIGLWAKCQV
jgi:hypothetical protein